MESCTGALLPQSLQQKMVKNNTIADKLGTCPQLPIELWIRIIGLITDSRYLPRAWLDFRRVSSHFKAATELAFSHRHLRNTEITFRDYGLQLKPCTNGSATVEDALTSGGIGIGRPLHLKFVLKYVGLSEDRERAVFRREAIPDETGALKIAEHGCTLSELMETRWRHILSQLCSIAGQERPRQPGTPPPASACPPAAAYVITTRRIANDTALPGFQVHHRQQGDDANAHDDMSTSDYVSVLWQPMFSQLFGEEEYLKWAKKVDYQHSAMRKNLDAMSAMVRTGELPLDEFFKLMSDYTSKNSRKVFDAVRRERLGRRALQSTQPGKSGSHIISLQEHLDVIERARESVFWAEFIDEWRFPGSEENEGNFYDGTGRLFQGKTETNKPDDEAAAQAKMDDCEVPGASWYAGSDCSEDEEVDPMW